jgi:branched-chain amino acid transport system substrate-binding protein
MTTTQQPRQGRRHRRRRLLIPILVVAGLLVAACGDDDSDSSGSDSTGTTTAAQQATGTPIKVGLLCDRSGPTQIIGVNLCPGFLDYIDLVNDVQGGVDNHPIEVIDVDHAYDVPKAVTAYEQMRAEGAVAILCYGTPIALGLNEQITRDEKPCLTPGFGIAQAGDPAKYPYQFPLAASYYSQAAAAVDYALANTDVEDPKIAYLYYDNPAGQEPLPIVEALSEREGFELKTFAVPAPGLEMGAQISDITERYKADFVIAHLFGRAPSVSIKGFREAGYPLEQVVSLVWGGAEADIEAAGGFALAEGYSALQFAEVGQDFEPIDAILAMYEAKGEDPPSALSDNSVYYNRGVFVAALLVEGLRNALEAGDEVTGPSLKAGLEQLTEFDAGGLAPPLTVSPTDHEGGGYTRVFQVKDGELTPVTEWDNPDHQLVLDEIASS